MRWSCTRCHVWTRCALRWTTERSWLPALPCPALPPLGHPHRLRNASALTPALLPCALLGCAPPQIDPQVDSDPRAAYFRQARNGLYVRMALLKLCLQGRDLGH